VRRARSVSQNVSCFQRVRKSAAERRCAYDRGNEQRPSWAPDRTFAKVSRHVGSQAVTDKRDKNSVKPSGVWSRNQRFYWLLLGVCINLVWHLQVALHELHKVSLESYTQHSKWYVSQQAEVVAGSGRQPLGFPRGRTTELTELTELNWGLHRSLLRPCASENSCFIF